MLLAAGLAALFLRMFSNPQDPREPPLIPASTPYISHAISIMRSKFNYYVQLRYREHFVWTFLPIKFESVIAHYSL